MSGPKDLVEVGRRAFAVAPLGMDIGFDPEAFSQLSIQTEEAAPSKVSVRLEVVWGS